MAVIAFKNQAHRKDLGKMLYDWIVDHRSGAKSLEVCGKELHEWLKSLGSDIYVIEDETTGNEVPYDNNHTIEFLADGKYADNKTVLVLPAQLPDDKNFQHKQQKEAQLGDYFMKKCR